MKTVNQTRVWLVLLLMIALTQLQAQSTEFYGMTFGGGPDDLGTIFKTDHAGANQEVVYSFASNQGKRPQNGKLCAVDATLYGTTNSGGTNDMGVLYQYNSATESYVVLHNFDGENSGADPYSNVIMASNGKLYGTTLNGGSYNYGTLFEYDLVTNTFTKKVDFDGATKGKNIYANVIEASNGQLYGVSHSGGLNGVGVLYEYDIITDVFTKLVDFEEVSIGRVPTILVEVEDGVFYGTCSVGGIHGHGTIFKYVVSTNTISKKFDFDSAVSGRAPYLSLTKATNGMLYGLTRLGGQTNQGILYEYNLVTETFIKKQDFDPSTGFYAHGSVTEGINGKLYGLTSYGGLNNDGTIFEFDPLTNIFVKKFDFNGTVSGKSPWGTFAKGIDGKLFATAYSGGTANSGVLFEYDVVTNVYKKRIDFNYATMGKFPMGSFIQATNGKLYAIASEGGANDYGTLFSFDPAFKTFKKLYDFDHINAQVGATPYILQSSNGKIYGIATYGSGIIFEYDIPNNSLQNVHTFADLVTWPSGFVELPNGNLLGITLNAGLYGGGILYEFSTSTYTLTKKFDFNDTVTGYRPMGNLLRAANNKYYGMALGGIYVNGVLFEYDLASNILTKKIDFDGVNSGSAPNGSLVQAANGKLYGLVREGGINGLGILFEYEILTNSFLKKLDFDGLTTGGIPSHSLIEAENGKLYGLASIGGANNMGSLFEYETNTDNFTTKFDFNFANGRIPVGNLLEVSNSNLGISDHVINSAELILWPNPVDNFLTIKTRDEVEFGWKIYNLPGQELHSSRKNQNNHQIEVSDLRVGIYIIEVIMQNRNFKNIQFVKR